MLRTGNSLYWSTGIDNSGLKQGTQEGMGILRGFAGNVSKLDIFAGLGASAAYAFGRISQQAYQTSKDFDLAMREVQSISSAVKENFLGISDEIVEISKEVPDTMSQLGKAYYQIVSAGYDGAAGLEILEKASKGAVAGVTDTTTAADAFTTVLNAWKLEAEEVTEVSDMMFRTVQLGKTTFPELAGSIAKVAPLAASANVQFADIAAIVATLTKQGTPTAEAFTQIRGAMVALNEQLGEGWGNQMSLLEGFQELQNIADRTGKNINEVTGRIEGALAVLGTTGANLEGAKRDLEEIQNAAGASAEAFGDMSQAAENNLKILGNNITAKLKPLGDGIMEIVDDTARGINRMFKGAMDPIKEIRQVATDEIMKLNRLFSQARNTDIDIRREAIEAINEEYGDYLENLLTEESSLRDIEKAQRAATKALEAEITVKMSREKMEEAMVELADVKSDKTEKLLAEYGDKYGLQSVSVFMTAYNKAIDQAAASGDWIGAGTSNAFVNLYEQYLNGLDPLNFNFDKWADNFEEVVQAQVEANNTVKRIEAEASTYQDTLDKIKKSIHEAEESDEGDGVDQEPFNVDEFKDRLAKAKAAYEEMKVLREEGTFQFVEGEYQSLTDISDSWEGYLTEMYYQFEGNTEAMRQLLLEFAEISVEQVKPKNIAQRSTEEVEKEYKQLAEQIEKDFADAFEDLDEELFPQEKTDEFIKQIKDLWEAFDDADLKKFLDKFYGAGAMLEGMGDIISEFNSELGSAVSNMGELVSDGANLATSMATGNPVGAITSAMSMVGNLVSFFKDLNKEAVDYTQQIEQLNEHLEKQKEILEGGARYGNQEKLYLNYIETLQKELKKIEETWFVDSGGGSGRRNNSAFNLPEQVIEQYEDLKAELKEIEKEYQDFMAGGITENNIANEIAQAFEDGKTSVKDFAEYSENVMRDAVMETFRSKILGEALTEAQEYLSEGLEDGIWTDTEAAKFTEMFQGAAEGMKPVWESLTSSLDIFGDMGNDQEGLKGSISSITEQTAGILAGQMGAIRINVIEQLDVARDSLDTLQQIESNTAILKDIYEEVKGGGSMVSERSQGR